MIALAPDDRREVQRWMLSGLLALVAHASLAAAMVQWRERAEEDAAAAPIVIDLSLMPVAPMELPNDLVPEEQQPDTPPELKEEKVEERLEPLPNPEVVMEATPPEQKPDPRPRETRPPPAPQAPATRQAALPAAPAQGAPSLSNPNAIPNWKSQIIGILERNKRYPSEARSRRQQGVAQVAFSLDRQGRVVSTRIVTSSGSPALDQEALELARRAQPFPPPPAELPGAQITLQVPIRFDLR